MKLIDIIIFLIPLISGYTMSLLCPMKKESGSNIPARPPAWVFGVVWPILYILMGLSWVLLRKEKDKTIVDILFFLLIIALNSWLFAYSCLKKKKIALYILLISLVFVLAIWGYSIGTIYMFYLTPLVVWLIFACMLNFTEINQSFIHLL